VASLNYFSGNRLRIKPRAGENLADLILESKLELRRLLNESGAEKLVLVGHSLGGLISTSILLEAEDPNTGPSLPVEAVMSISAPLDGSDLLGWAHGIGIGGLFTHLDDPIHRAMLPGSADTRHLQRRLKEGNLNSRSFRCITGGLDPMVSAQSAILETFPVAERPDSQVYPHLMHYNIAISGEVWRDIAHWILHL